MENLKEIKSVQEVEEILKERLSKKHQYQSFEEIPDESLFTDMDKATDIFIKNYLEKKRIIFIHDSDNDGLMSYLIAYEFFSKYMKDGNIELYITNRNEGYGFLPLHRDKYGKADLWITADNGITAKDTIKYILDMDPETNIIITDHHQIDPNQWPLYPEDKKDQVAVIDQWQPGDNFPEKDITGTTVLYFFLKHLAKKMGIIPNIVSEEDFYIEFLAENAITSISDVMPIDGGLARFFVYDFFVNKKYELCQRQYFKTWMELKNLAPRADDIAFAFVPSINATQRIASAEHAALYFVQKENDKALEWLNYIDKLNEIRKERQQKLLDYVEKTYKEYLPNQSNNLKFIMIPGKFHSSYKGLMGIVAGRLAEKYNVPAIVLNYNEETKVYSGSGRSVGSIDILNLFREVEDLTHHLGGHKQALGVGIPEENIDEFYNKILELTRNIPEEDFQPIIKTTGYVDLKNLNIDWYYILDKFEPFGHHFSKPSFTTKAKVKKVNIIGKQKNHMILTLTDSDENLEFKGLWFFHKFEPQVNKEYEIIFQPDIDSWKGQDKLSLRILHIKEL